MVPRLQVAYYCSKECQAGDWKQHKAGCKTIAAQQAAGVGSSELSAQANAAADESDDEAADDSLKRSISVSLSAGLGQQGLLSSQSLTTTINETLANIQRQIIDAKQRGDSDRPPQLPANIHGNKR